MKSLTLKHSISQKRNEFVKQQTTFVQPKLMVDAPNDVYEQEADAVADRVMRMPLVSSKSIGIQGMLASSVQRKCADCEEEEKKKPIMRKSESGGGFETSPAFASQLSNTRGGGQVIPRETKSFMESRFGQDFSHVRLHTDGTAANMNRDIQAKAFTHGSDIYFNRGEFAPNTEGGKRLLAHELTHTVQQNATIHREALTPNSAPELFGLTTPAVTPRTVYLCSKPLDTSPVGSHAFFRVGGTGVGNTTYSLQPIDSSSGADCWQGIPDINYPSDYNATGTCIPTSISLSCLQSQHTAYPIGHYCTWGPNSNTYVGQICKSCGIANPDPSGVTPGIDAAKPPSGTYAPDKWTTLLFGCSTKQCVSTHDLQIACVARLGGCFQTRAAGVPTEAEIARYNETCRRETGNSGEDVTPDSTECQRYFGNSSE